MTIRPIYEFLTLLKTCVRLELCTQQINILYTNLYLLTDDDSEK